jgi:hypothetical protein
MNRKSFFKSLFVTPFLGFFLAKEWKPQAAEVDSGITFYTSTSAGRGTFTINSSGDFRIGTTTPSHILHVRSSVLGN